MIPFEQQTTNLHGLKVGASADFDANQMDLLVRSEAQQLRSREPLAHDYLTALVQTYQMKTRLTEINQCRFVCVFSVDEERRKHSMLKAADHPIK